LRPAVYNPVGRTARWRHALLACQCV